MTQTTASPFRPHLRQPELAHAPRVASKLRLEEEPHMIRKSLWTAAALFALAFVLTPAGATAQAIGICTVGNTCSLETRLPGQNLCGDGIDNDGNGLFDGNDPHCQSEVLCEDGFDNDGNGGTDTADVDCQCVAAAATALGGTGFGGNACTANDITIAYTASPLVFDGCINSTDTVVAQLTATVTTNPERWDLGMWISLDGGNALSGPVCARQALMPVAISPTVPDPTDPAGDGPFNDIDGDRCGDRQAGSSAIYKFPFAVNVPCTDLILSSGGQGGFVDLGQCGSWVQPAQGAGNPNCQNPTNAVPGTSSKCSCARGDTSIPGPNFGMTCTPFQFPGNLGTNGTLDPGETAAFSVDFTNTVANCTSGAPAPTDPYGRARCGTASFLRIVVNYGTNAEPNGDFYYNNGATDQIIPTCGGTPGLLANDAGVVCNDVGANRLIFAPTDPSRPINTGAYAVVGAFAGTRSMPFGFKLNLNAPPITLAMESVVYWDDVVYTTANGRNAAEAVVLTGAIAQPACTNCRCTNSVTATPVTLSSFRATPAGRSVRFDWTTDTEVGNVGFNLYAAVAGERIRLNDEIVPSQGGDSLEPQRYEADLSVPDGAESFFVEDIDLRGETRLHGPFAKGKRHGLSVESEPIDWSSVRREHGLPRDGGERVAFRRNESRLGARANRSGPVTASPTTIEILVDRSGLHRVTYEQLAAGGFDLAGQTASQLGLSARGVPVPIFVGGGGKFGPGSYIEFWGEALDTLYTKTNVYRLATGVKKAARAVIDTAAAAGVTAPTYDETRNFERNRTYAYWSDANDPFYDTSMRVFTTPGQTSFPFTIDGLDATGGDARLRVVLYGTTSIAQIDPDHHVQFLVNGAMVGEVWFDGNNGAVFEGAVPSTTLVEGANMLVLRQPADTGASMDIVVLDEFSVTYPRVFRAIGGSLAFRRAAESFAVNGLPAADVVAYRRDGSTLTRLAGTAVVAEGASYRALVPGSSTASEYAVASVGSLLQPAAIQSSRPSIDIRSGAASYLILTHSAFLNGLDALVAARSAAGHTVRVVDVEDVYSQYAGGVFDPDAIRAFVKHAYTNMGTRYVLLVGGDSYDYRNYLGTGAVSFVPTLYRATGEIVQWAPADAAYADVDDDGIQDLAIGRLPVRSTDELASVVAKTLQYEAGASARKGIFAADFLDPAANESFQFASERLVSKLSSDWQVSRVYLDLLGVGAGRTQLFGSLQSGAALTLYLGHSGNTSWGSASAGTNRLLTVNDVATLPNAGLPTVVAQVGCWNNYFVHPRVESLGGRLALVQDRGAAAVLGSGTLTDDVDNNRFGSLLAERLTGSGVTIGDALRDAKRSFAEESRLLPEIDVRDITFGWNLLGDPALVVTP